MRGAAPGRVFGSPKSRPVSPAMKSAQSPTLPAITPIVSSDSAHHLHAAAVQGAEARLEADRAAEGRGADDAAGGLGAETGMEEPRRRARRRPRGRAARRMRRIARIGGGTGVPRGELRRHRLAEDDRPCPPRQRHRGRVRARPVPGPDRRAVLRRHVGGVQHVLDPEEQAVQRPERAAGAPGGVGPRRRAAHSRRIVAREGAQRRLADRDAVEQRLRQFRGGQGAVPQARTASVAGSRPGSPMQQQPGTRCGGR